MIAASNEWVVSQQELDEIKWKANNRDWAQAIVAHMKAKTDFCLREPIIVPPITQGNVHQYISDDASWWLVFDPDNPQQHQDPLYEKVFEHDKIKDHAWAWVAHNLLWRKMLVMGVLFQLTGNDEYLRWVKDALMQYAQLCAVREEGMDGLGSVFRGPLYDAKFLIGMASAYQYIDGPISISVSEAQAIRQMLHSRAMYLLSARMDDAQLHLGDQDINNFVTYMNAAISCASVILGEKEWLDIVTHDSRGFYKSLELITPGGMWWEDSMAYHWYTVDSFEVMRDVLKNADQDPLRDYRIKEKFLSLYAFGLSLASEDGTLPMIGDAFREVSLRTEIHHIEYAAGRVDPRYASVLAWLYREGRARNCLWALLHGPIDLPEAEQAFTIHRSASYLSGVAPEESGISVLRQKGTERITVWFKHGPRYLKHGHLDMLGVSIHALGCFMSADLATYGYGNPIVNYDYYESAIAHNTLLIDGEPQRGGHRSGDKSRKSSERIGGRLLYSIHDETRCCAVGRAEEEVYPGCCATRAVIVENEGHVIIIDELRTNRDAMVDFIYRNAGQLITKPEKPGTATEERIQGKDIAYSFLRVDQLHRGTTKLTATWLLDEHKAMKGFFVSDQESTDIYCGRMPVNPAPLTSGFVLLRSGGAVVRYAAVLAPQSMEPGDPVFDDDYRVLQKDQWCPIEGVGFASGNLIVETRQRRTCYALSENRLIIEEQTVSP